MAGNSLQAMLDRAKLAEPEAVKLEDKASRKRRDKGSPQRVKNDVIIRSEPKPSRVDTKLIGGHFPPQVSMQLRIIAAEEDTTIQNLLAEALDDLFVKKGKARIASL